MSGPVEAMLDTAQPLTEGQSQASKKKAIEIKKAMSNLTFGVESVSLHQLSKRAKILDLYGAGFRKLSLDPLKWRDKKNQLPVLAVFSLDSPTCEIGVNYDHMARSLKSLREPKMPEKMRECYNDIVKRCRTVAEKEKLQFTYIKTTYLGSPIPAELKAKTLEAQSSFEQVFLIAEVAKWDLIKGPEMPPPMPMRAADPIIAGWAQGQLWLIGSYDLTTLENYVTSEFSS